MSLSKISLHYRCILQNSVLLSLLLLAGCSEKIPFQTLEELKSPQTLRVGFIPTPGLFFPDNELDLGMDYDLVNHFADSQQRKLIPIQVQNIEQLENYLEQGKIDIALPGSGYKPTDNNLLASESYRLTDWFIVYNQKNTGPYSQKQDHSLSILANSNADNVLEGLSKKQKEIKWEYVHKTSLFSLLNKIKNNRLHYTIIDNDSFLYFRRLFPNLKASYTLKEQQKNVWLCQNKKLLEKINVFLTSRNTKKLIATLDRHYQKYLYSNNYVEKLYFLERIETRLEQYIPLFKEASKKSLIDWRLLAAISYQESHWNPDARSFTGVKGLMMLTQATAKQVGVKDRTDPKESIIGGAKYLNVVDKKIPERILAHDRLWFTLAAYNVGYGHLEDARLLTQQNNGNPDDWTDVREFLKKLSKPKWYSKTKHGYARGLEPVYYVEHIRRYYTTLKLYLYYQQQLHSD